VRPAVPTRPKTVSEAGLLSPGNFLRWYARRNMTRQFHWYRRSSLEEKSDGENAAEGMSYDVRFYRLVLFGWDWVIGNKHCAACGVPRAFQTTVELVSNAERSIIFSLKVLHRHQNTA
jgi:hypothetical protein